MKTVVISIFQSFLARSVLGTEAFRKLSADKNIKIVILAPDFKKDFYEKNFGSDNVTVEAVDDYRLRKLSTTLSQRIATLLLPTHFVKYRIKQRLPDRKYLNFIANVFINRVLGPSEIAHRIFRFIDHRVSATDLFDHYLEKYNPDLVFATDIFSPTDAHLLLAAEKQGVKSIGLVRSWDCTTNKNLLRIIPSRIAVNNTFVKEELVRLHDVDGETIIPVGFSQFDAYINIKSDSREEFFKKIGADINKRLILFAPAGNAQSDVDYQYCEILDKAINEGRIPKNIQFLVSKHPQDTVDLGAFEHNPNFIIEQIGKSFINNAKATEVDETAIRHLLNYIYHSDLLISLNTSLGLDAVIFDKPQIMIGFDGYEGFKHRKYFKSIKDYHKEDNMLNYINTGAVRVAGNQEELFELINKYLDNPALNAAGREKARQTILYKVDGKSGERIADFVLKSL